MGNNMWDFLQARHSIVSVLPCPFLSCMALVNYAHTIILNKRKVSRRVSEQSILKYKEIPLEITWRAALKHCPIRKYNLQMLVLHFQTEKGESQEQWLGFFSGVSHFKDIIQGYNAGGTVLSSPFCEENDRRSFEFQNMLAIILKCDHSPASSVHAIHVN